LIVFAALGLLESAQGVGSTAEKGDGDSGLKGVQEDGKEGRKTELLLAVREEEGRPGNGCARTEGEAARADSAAQTTQEDGAEVQDESGEHTAHVASRSTVASARTGRSVGTALDDGRVQGDEEVQEDRDSDVGHVQTVEDELQQENLNE
jgi:hypothetical protein